METVKKALAILELFIDREEIGISELAKSTGLNISTIHSICSVFVKKGYLRQRQKRGKYSLGLKFLTFGGVATQRIKVQEIAYPFMRELSRQVNESVNFSVIYGYENINTGLVRSPQKLRVFVNVTVRLPLYSSGTGKVFLAHMTEEELERYLKSTTFTSHTPNTITDPRELKKQLLVIRKEGVAFDNEETLLGVNNVAAPVKNWDGVVIAAIGVLGPSSRLNMNRMKKIAPTVKSYALKISQQMGNMEG